MTYLVSIFVFFCLILFQSTVIPALFGSVNIYDLLIILIIYIGFFRSMAESLPVVLLLGVTMDSISGGAFGIHTTTYLWLYTVVAVVIKYLHVDSRILLIVAIVAGVLWENAVILITIVIKNLGGGFSVAFIKIIGVQILWAIFTGPIVFYLIKNIHAVFGILTQQLFDSNKQKSDFKIRH